MSFENQRVVVIGGTSGIGLEVARRMVAEGANVTIAGRRKERAEQAASALGGGVEGVSLDVTDEAQVEAFFQRVGELDHLVTTAAASAMGPIVDGPVGPARALVESKVWGQYLAVKHAVPRLSAGGSITLFSGTVSARPMAGASAFAMAGAAVEALTRVLAIEAQPIRVNTVVPGVVQTEAWDALLDEMSKAAFFESTGAQLPVGRVGRPEEIAEAVLFLAGNGFVNGTTLVVDGGHRLV